MPEKMSRFSRSRPFAAARDRMSCERPALLEGGGMGEDDLADRRPEVAPLVGVAGLEDHRLALRRALDVQRADDLEVFALVLEPVLSRPVEEHFALPVAWE